MTAAFAPMAVRVLRQDVHGRVGSLPPWSRPLPARDAALGVSVVMPAHNEEGLLDTTLTEVTTALRSRDLTFEVLVVENGSTDATLAVARGFATEADPVVVLTRPAPTTARPCGPGSSAPRATSWWSSTSTTTTPTSSTWCSRSCTAPDGPAIVVGSKRAPGTTDTRPWPRRAITAGFAAVLRFGFDLGVSDTHGMKAMRREVVEPDRAPLPERHRPVRHRAGAARRPGRTRGGRGAGDGRGTATRRAPRSPGGSCARSVGTRPAPGPALEGLRLPACHPGLITTDRRTNRSGRVDPRMTPRFAAGLSQHPVRVARGR